MKFIEKIKKGMYKYLKWSISAQHSTNSRPVCLVMTNVRACTDCALCPARIEPACVRKKRNGA